MPTYLCLAYGREEDWTVLTEERQHELLAGDEVIRARGAQMAIVHDLTTVTAHDGPTVCAVGTYVTSPAPLAGFSIIEAASLDEVAALVAKTPCAEAGGAIEVREMESPGAGLSLSRRENRRGNRS
jgi:hypothetical protein